jgi:putative NADH-flavin reductase
MRITVFGANGPTGRLVVAMGVAGGHDVVAVTRHPEGYPRTGAEVVGGDVGDPDAVARAVRGADVVLSALGVPFSKEAVDVYSYGGRHIVDAMRDHGVSRLAVVTSSVLAPHPRPQGGLVFRKVVQPYVVNKLGRTLYDDMGRLERLVADSGLAWTIVRPSGLFDHDRVTDYVTGEDHVLGRFTARHDLAHLLLAQATSATWVGRAVGVATTAVRPSMASLVWREGIRKKAPAASAPIASVQDGEPAGS